MNDILPFLTAFVAVLLLVPPIRKAALRIGFVDLPGGRKIHSKPIALMGGVAVYLGCMVSMLIFSGWTTQSLAVLTGGTLLLITGLTDDWYKSQGREFPVWPRLIIYLAASAIPIIFGIRIIGITNPWDGGMLIFPAWIASLATMAWVFGIMNMTNFIDGVDGLAAGIITLASVTLLIASVWYRQTEPGILAAVLAGGCLAFLGYNFYPAKIFLGDAGAVFLGYAISLVAINGAFKMATVISLLVPILALGVPIFDTAFVFIRRFVRGSGFHRADKLHSHHTLMRWGLSQTQTVSFLYLVGISFSLISVILLLLFRP